MKLEQSISTLKNIGEKRLVLFHKLNIFNIKDLIFYLPRDYEDRSKIKKLDELVIDELNTFICKITKEAENLKIKNRDITKLKIIDDTDELEIVWFNQPYLKKNFKIGQEYIFSGKVREKFGKLQMETPEYEVIDRKELLSSGRIVPIYKTTYGLSQKIIRSIIKDALENVSDEFLEFIPKSIVNKYSLCDRKFAIQNIHFPISDENFFVSRKRLVFEELFLMQTSLLKIKNLLKKPSEGLVFDYVDDHEILKRMPYKLTNAQQNVLKEIKLDFKNGTNMNRLIQGDVGSGKTIIALLSCYIAIKNGFQASLMAPTEVLAMQHLAYFKSFFDELNINTVLLSGSQRKKEKRMALESILNADANMIIGTHAIIQEGVEFSNLGLVITDEQHRFGVKQREILTKKGDNPHILIMTATPIPRTLALILYGDLDISIIDELPPGRQKVDTSSVNSSYRQRINTFIKKEIDSGRQCYIVCSMIEESETSDLKAVLTYTELLKEEFENYSIEYLHGKMKQETKNDIMKRFSDGEISILVSTTVIEVGINVVNATLMLIENAERFGLSQLHQLRGRVGRGSEKSYCILLSDTKNKVTKERLNAMVKSNDGFYISELDLKLRGPGDFFGTRQHGLPELKIANLYKDMEILKIAQKSAIEFVNNKLEVSDTEIEILNIELKTFFNADMENLQL